MTPSTWKLAKGATWRQKLEREHPNHGKLVPVPERWQKRFGQGMMVIPRPLDVDATIRRVRKGKLLTQSRLRQHLAEMSDAACACPLTTGIFVRIVAEAAEEDLGAGKKRVAPYWRLIRDDGKLLEKLPGGPAAQASRLSEEGFTLEPGRGKQPPRVRDFERHIAAL